MPILAYRDFEIAIIGDNENQPWYTWATYGNARAVGTLAFKNGKAWLAKLIKELDDGKINGNELRILGEEMYESLFSDKIGNLFSNAESNLPPDTGLRVSINIQPSLLNRLPWEFLYDNKFLAIYCRTPIVRKLPMMKMPNGTKITKKLKILILISSPKDQPPLNVKREAAFIKFELKNLEKSGYVELKIVTHATQEKLEEILRTDFDVFHFIGHAEFDTFTQKGSILLEDDEGNTRYYNGEILGALLNGARVKMAILNACETAKSSADRHMLGIGHSLLHADIPFVIAMQFRIYDIYAILFAKRFYMEMASGEQIDTALTRARQSIVGSTGMGTIDWGIPVLYETNPGNFKFRPTSKKSLKQTLPKKPSPAQSNVIGICDINSLLIDMESIAKEMNSLQDYFNFQIIPGFYSVEMFQRRGEQVYCSFEKAALRFKEVFKKYESMNLRTIVGVTQNLITSDGWINLFSESIPPLSIVSTYDLEEYAQSANRSFEQAVMYLIFGALTSTYGSLEYHPKTKSCLMDFCGNRGDIVKGLRTPKLDDSCRSKISNPQLLSALDKYFASFR